MKPERKIKPGFNPILHTSMYDNKEQRTADEMDDDHLNYAIELAKKGLSYIAIRDGVNDKFKTGYGKTKIYLVTKRYKK